MSNASTLAKHLTNDSSILHEDIGGCRDFYKLIQSGESTMGTRANWVVTLTVNVMACPLTILFNLLVIAAVKRRPTLQNNANILLACLAGVDALTGLVVQPLLIAEAAVNLSHTEDHSRRCLLLSLASGAFHVFCFSSIFHLALVTLERYIAIKYTLHYLRLVTKRNIRIAVVSIWVLTITMELLRFVVTWHLEESTRYFSLLTVLAMVCFVKFIVSCHVILFRETSRHRRRIKTEQISQEDASGKFLTENKALKATAWVVAALLLCYFPLMLFMLLIMQLKVLLKLIPILRPWVPALAALNSLLNPCIYCWRQEEMRKFIFRNPFSASASTVGHG